METEGSVGDLPGAAQALPVSEALPDKDPIPDPRGRRRPVPSVRTLCQTYGIARATATKSLRILADEGLIHRVPGRGWFVVPGA